jgi:hypothetical protein
MTSLIATSTAQLFILGAGLLVATVVAAIALRRGGPQRPAPRPNRPQTPQRTAGGYARPRIPQRERYAALERMAAERRRS